MAPSESIALNLSQCHHCDKAIGQLDTCSSLAHSSLAFGRIISIPRQRSFQWPSPVLPYLGSQSTITGLPLTNETFWRLFPYWQDIVFSFSRSQLSSLQHSVTPRLKLEKIRYSVKGNADKCDHIWRPYHPSVLFSLSDRWIRSLSIPLSLRPWNRFSILVFLPSFIWSFPSCSPCCVTFLSVMFVSLFYLGNPRPIC